MPETDEFPNLGYSGTKFPELFQALAAPFDGPGEVKTRAQSGRTLRYITARTAMNRLDNVLGNENWWDEFSPHENSVLCKLTIRLPDGSILTKQDAGGYAGMADHGDDDKSGYSDGFKRACVKFGVARYLYNDGVPNYGGPDPTVTNYSQTAPPANGDARTPTAPAASLPNPPRTGKALFKTVKDLEEAHGGIALIKPLNDWARSQGVKDRMTDWPEHFLSAAWAYVSGLVPAGEPEAVPSEVIDARPASVKELRDDFYRLCYSIVVKVFDLRGEPEMGRIKEECNRVASMLMPGRTIPTFADLKDADDLRALVAKATERYREVMAGEVAF